MSAPMAEEIPGVLIIPNSMCDTTLLQLKVDLMSQCLPSKAYHTMHPSLAVSQDKMYPVSKLGIITLLDICPCGHSQILSRCWSVHSPNISVSSVLPTGPKHWHGAFSVPWTSVPRTAKHGF